MEIDFTIEIFREGTMFVSYAPEFDLSSCGETVEVARKNLVEAAKAFIDEARNMSTLGDILEEAGFEKQGNSWVGPEFISFEKTKIAFSA